MSVKKQLYKLQTKANKIYESNELSWKEKYDLIFSDNISKKIHNIIDLDYYNPDMDYEDDVSAFMSALNDYVNRKAKYL